MWWFRGAQCHHPFCIWVRFRDPSTLYVSLSRAWYRKRLHSRCFSSSRWHACTPYFTLNLLSEVSVLYPPLQQSEAGSQFDACRSFLCCRFPSCTFLQTFSREAKKRANHKHRCSSSVSAEKPRSWHGYAFRLVRRHGGAVTRRWHAFLVLWKLQTLRTLDSDRLQCDWLELSVWRNAFVFRLWKESPVFVLAVKKMCKYIYIYITSEGCCVNKEHPGHCCGISAASCQALGIIVMSKQQGGVS